MRRATLLAVAGIVLAAALPVLSARVRGPGPPRCSRDGTVLGGTLAIRAERADEPDARFCSVRCAEDWTLRAGAGWRVLVADEPSGRELPAAEAWFVRSRVVASRATGEGLHAFASRDAAAAHAARYGGRVLEGEDRPFGSVREEEPTR